MSINLPYMTETSCGSYEVAFTGQEGLYKSLSINEKRNPAKVESQNIKDFFNTILRRLHYSIVMDKNLKSEDYQDLYQAKARVTTLYLTYKNKPRKKISPEKNKLIQEIEGLYLFRQKAQLYFTFERNFF